MNRIGVHISVKSCALAFMALLFLAPVYLKAQTVTGRILGNILDSSGGAVPNAEIIITNQDTGVSRASVSNNDGVYVVPALLPGKYSVEAKSQGFNTATVKDVVVAVGSEARVDLQLQIGSSTQAVTVTESIPTVEATSSEV